MCLAGVESIVCKHAKPIIYTAKAAVPEARKAFLATGQIRKTLTFLGGRIKFAFHMVRTFEGYWPAWSSGWIFHSSSLILKTISQQTCWPPPWTIWDLKYWFWPESLNTGPTSVCLQEELNLSLKECSRLSVCGADRNPDMWSIVKGLLVLMLSLWSSPRPLFHFYHFLSIFWSPSLGFSLKPRAHWDGIDLTLV